MQAARDAVGNVREKGKSFLKPKYADQLLGSGLEEQIRRATAKNLPGPDLALNRRIVETINNDLNSYSAHQLATVLKGRLQLKNAHKQWLALELIQEILESCSKVIEPARADILEDVAQIAAQPMNRYGSDLPGQQHCKNASFALLKKYGHEGQDAMREAVGLSGVARYDKDDVPSLSNLGRKSQNDPYSSRSDAYNSNRNGTYGRDSHREGSGHTDNSSFSSVREKVQMGIATSHSHTEMLQDMVLNLSEGAGRRESDHDKTVLKDLVKEMVAFRNKFEGTLEALSQFETHEAQSLMTEALEAMDMMNNAIILQNEVLTARKTKQQDSFGRSTSGSSGREGAAASRLAPPPGAAPSASQTLPVQQAPPPPVQPPQPSYLDAITELQQAMDRAHVSSGPPTPQQGDPFASSYFHPAASGQANDPFAQPNFGQPSAAASQYQSQQPPQQDFQYGSQPGSQYSNQQGSQFGGQQPGQYGNQQSSQFGNQGGGQFVNQQGSQFGSQQGPQYSGQQSSQYGSQYAPQQESQFVPQQQAQSQGSSGSRNPFAAAGGGGGFGAPSLGQPGQNANSGSYPYGSAQPSANAPSFASNSNASGAGQAYNNTPQQFGAPQPYRAPASAAADPFDHLPYPSLGLTRPTKPERAPAPPLASLGKAQAISQQVPGQQAPDQRSMSQGPDSLSQQVQQQQPNLGNSGSNNNNSSGSSNIWAQQEAGQKGSADAAFDFGESAFNPTPPQQGGVPPQQGGGRPKEAFRPKNLYINSLYGSEDGAGDAQLPPGFDPNQQTLTRGTGSWGMTSPTSSPGRGGGYQGGSGPPTPEGLQYPPHNASTGSSGATTPAQASGNSEWDMFFANRVQPNGNAGPAGLNQAPQQQQQTAQLPDAFDELLSSRR